MKATDRFSSVAFRGAGLLLALLLSGTACLALAQAPATPGKFMVNDVIPEGNAQVPTPKIMSLIRTRPGNEYLQETVNEDLRRLYETHLFRNVDVALQYTPDGKVNVYYRFIELPSTIQEIVYNGAGHLKPDELDTLTGLHKGTPLNPVANQMACQAIVRRYHDDGRAFASCQLVEGGQLGDTRVVFNITEGPVIKVSAIEFVGNSTFVSSARLATQVNSSHEWFGFIGGRYNETMSRLDASKLEEYYKSFGYQDVHVSMEPIYEPDLRHVRLVFHIEEGQRYKVKDTVVTGVKAFTPEQVSVLPRLHKGDFYNEGAATADEAAIKDYYGWAGYPATVKKEIFYPEPGLCLVRYDVQERPPSRVGQIFIVGNEVSRQNVILRQVPLFPGQVLTYPDLKTAEHNLDRLGIFTDPATGQHPTVSVIDPEVDSPFKDILVQVQEQRTGSLLFGVGVNSDAGLTGSVVLNERNFDILRPPTSVDDLLSGRAFRGAGQEFRLEAMPGTQVQRYAATFREPFLFDSPYSLTVGGYYFTRQYDEYNESRLGARVTIGRKLNQYWSVSGTVRVEDVGVHDVVFFAPQDFQSVVGDNLLVGFRAGVTRDSRDSFLRPTQGSLLDISVEEVTGDFTFPIVNVEGSKFWTVYQRPDGSGRHVLALHSQFGWEGDEAPVFERFYAGGFRSLRGFAFRGVGPEVDGFRVGGDFQFLNSLEYQVPIKANDQMFLVAFIDSGTVEQRLEIKDYRVTAGVGVRFVVPMLGPVPIALDVGFPIVKGPNDHEQDFSFWLGFFH
jgi:outer membrane protein assembly complex protein YaeT